MNTRITMSQQRIAVVTGASSGFGKLTVEAFAADGWRVFGIYAASKWALEALAETSSYELAPFGVDVAIVEPGDYPTEAFAKMGVADDRACTASYGSLATSLSDAVNAGRAGIETRDSADVARAIMLLANAPAGTRPLRTTIPANPAADTINAAVAPIQTSVLAAFGLGDLANARWDHIGRDQ